VLQTAVLEEVLEVVLQTALQTVREVVSQVSCYWDPCREPMALSKRVMSAGKMPISSQTSSERSVSTSRSI
jgi:hypothetical protein